MSCLLFVNGERQYQKAASLNCSGVILDLEDAVHHSQKEAARNALSDYVLAYRNPRQKLYIRINGLDTPFWQEDVAAAVKVTPDGLLVPKAEKDIEMLDQYLLGLENQHGLQPNSIKLILILETALSLVDMEHILASSKRIQSATIGMADLAADLGTSWEDLTSMEPVLLIPQRERLALVARKLGLEAPWDSVYMQFKNEEGFRKDAMIGKRLGFQGKHVIHPSQIEVVNEIYRVTEAEYQKATEILTRIEGLGAAQMEGLLIDEPMIKRARQIIERYHAQEESR